MPKIVDHDQYRQELLSKCLNIIAEKGYAAITMRQIAAGLGVSTGTLYHYFPSKESLFEQLVEYISYQDTSPDMIAELKKLPTLEARLTAIFEFIAQHEDYFTHQTLMLTDFCRQRERSEINQNEILQRAGRRYETAIMEVLEIKDTAIGLLIGNFIEGVVVRRLYQGDRVSFQKQAQLLGTILATYLERQEQPPEASVS